MAPVNGGENVKQVLLQLCGASERQVKFSHRLVLKGRGLSDISWRQMKQRETEKFQREEKAEENPAQNKLQKRCFRVQKEQRHKAPQLLRAKPPTARSGLQSSLGCRIDGQVQGGSKAEL